MKLKNNSGFEGFLIVLFASAKLLKTKKMVEALRFKVRLPHLQENISPKPCQRAIYELSRYPFPTPFGHHRQVENLSFVGGNQPPNQEPYDLFSRHRHQEFIAQVISHIPRRSFRTPPLDGCDFVQIPCTAAPDYCHIVIMHALFPLLFFLVQPFWEAKPPEAWTDAQIQSMVHDSPWAQTLPQVPPVTVFLATAAPIEHAEAELRLRLKKNPHPMSEPDADYLEFLSAHREDSLVLAITYPTLSGLGNATESKRMEDECVMVVGKKAYQITGHFPPTPSDPVLRLVFPRVVKSSDKSVLFRLYLQGLTFPERELEFRVKDLMYQGKLEM